MVVKDIKDFEGIYQIDETGRLFSLVSNQYLKPAINRGYRVITLWNKGKSKQFRYARLYATYFLPNPNNLPLINHIDGNKLNDSLDNLEWCTPQENTVHSWKLELSKYSKSYKRSLNCSLKCRKFTKQIEEQIRNEYKNQKVSMPTLAKKYECCRQTILKIVNYQHKIKH